MYFLEFMESGLDHSPFKLEKSLIFQISQIGFLN